MTEKRSRGRPRRQDIRDPELSEGLTPRQAADEIDLAYCTALIHPDAPYWPRKIRLEIGRSFRELIGNNIVYLAHALDLYADPATSEEDKQEAVRLTRAGLPAAVKDSVRHVLDTLGTLPAHEIAADLRRIRYNWSGRAPRFDIDRQYAHAVSTLGRLALARAYAIDSSQQRELARSMLSDALERLAEEGEEG
jgi:hypothetical protein